MKNVVNFYLSAKKLYILFLQEFIENHIEYDKEYTYIRHSILYCFPKCMQIIDNLFCVSSHPVCVLTLFLNNF